MIDKLCTECSALIENHEKIQILSAVHYNLGKTLQVGQHLKEVHAVVSASVVIKRSILHQMLVLLSSAPSAVASAQSAMVLLQDVENIVALPNEAAEAEEMLKDDSQLLQVLPPLRLLHESCAPYSTALHGCCLHTHWSSWQPDGHGQYQQHTCQAGWSNVHKLLCIQSQSTVFTASTGVVQAYESLAILEGTSSLAQQALQSGAKLKLEDTHNLNAYFNKVAPQQPSRPTVNIAMHGCCHIYANPTALTLSHHSDFVYSMHDSDQNVSVRTFFVLPYHASAY